MSELLHELILNTARQFPSRIAVIHKERQWRYQELAEQVRHFAQLLLRHQLSPNGRVAVYLPKQIETLVSLFGSSYAGGVMVPVNPQLKPPQVSHIINDSGAEFLITTTHRYRQCKSLLEQCSALRMVILIDGTGDNTTEQPAPQASHHCIYWAFEQKNAEKNSVDNSAEKLYRNEKIYDIFINIKYNYHPSVKKKGSAIFLHLTNINYKPTSGCISIVKKDFLKILPLINKKTRISIS